MAHRIGHDLLHKPIQQTDIQLVQRNDGGDAWLPIWKKICECIKKYNAYIYAERLTIS